jgi:hypothetical protein
VIVARRVRFAFPVPAAGEMLRTLSTLTAHVCLAVIAIAGCKERSKQASPAVAATSHATSRQPLKPSLEAETAPSDAPKTVLTIGFDWGAPCRVPAVQDVEKDGANVRIAFDVVFERDGERFVAKLDNMHVAEPQGTARAADVQRVVSALEGAVPPIAVAASGESEGAIDIDKAIDAALKLVDTKDARAMAMMRNMMANPQWKAAFAQKAGETWDVWVGTWTGVEIEANSERRETFDLPTAIGELKGVEVVMKHHGAVRGAPNLVLLSAEQVIDDPQLAALLGGVVQGMVPTGNVKVNFKKARKLDRNTVALDPVLGRPHRARHEMEVQINDRHQRTVRDTAFDWSRAAGCVPAPAPK